MSLAIRRFDFNGLQDFAAPAMPIEIVTDHTLPEVEEIVAPPPPSFSEEQLSAAKTAAFEEGRTAGRKEEQQAQETERKQRELAVQSAVQQLVQNAAQMQAQYQQFKALQTKELGALVMLMLRKAAGDALEHIPASGVENMLEECLGIMQAQPKFVVSVHPDIAPAVDAKLREMVDKHQLESAISVRVNERLGPSEARLDWPDGYAERNMEQIWQQIENKINQINFAQLAESEQTQ